HSARPATSPLSDGPCNTACHWRIVVGPNLALRHTPRGSKCCAAWEFSPVFGDARPARFFGEIWVANPDDGPLACSRCETRVEPKQIAMFTKTRVGDPFDPWCVDCAYLLVRWAGQGALATHAFDTFEAEQQMEDLIQRGRS